MKIAICGSTGKMGRQFIQFFQQEYNLILIHSKGISLKDIIKEVDVVVDFTNAKVAYEHGVIALSNHVPIIIGTTGLSKEQKEILLLLSKHNATGCMMASNFSIGMLWIKRNINELSRYFEEGKIIERHHISKIDSPSGTALNLKRILKVNIMPIISIREDSKIVKHRITLENENEAIMIEHVVKNPSAYMIQLEECIHDVIALRSFIEFE